MKTHVSILLGLMVIFSSLFVSCAEKELDSNICKITVKSDGYGIVSITDYIGTSVNIHIGNRVEVVATPDEGCAFIGWYVDKSETPVSTDAVFTFTVSENVTLTARFVKLSDIIIRSGGNGYVAFKDAKGNSIPVLPGAEVTVIATPYTDCDFVGWFVGDSETPISTEETYTFTVTENIILTGIFSKRPVVTVRSAGNGNVSIKDTYGKSKAFLAGTEATVIATPLKDCDFIGWFADNEENPVSTDLEYTFEVTEDITLTAMFSKRPIVTIKSTGNGDVSFKDYSGTSVAVLPDTEVTVIATPDENCEFVGWYIDKNLISTEQTFIYNVKTDVVLTAKFTNHILLVNGDFEEWNGGNPTAWGSGNIGHNATIAQSTEAYSGNYAVIVSGSATANKRLGSKSYTLSAGTYTISAYIKQEGSTAGVFKLAYGIIKNGAIANSDYKYQTSATTVTGEWKLYSFEFKLTETTEIAVLIMNSKVGNGASILVDNVTLTTADGNVSGDDNNGGNEQPDTPSTFTAVTSITSGAQYIIAAGTNQAAALDASKNYGYLPVVTVSPSNGTINTTDENVFVIEAVDGGYSIKDAQGRYLYMTGTYNSVNLSTSFPSEGGVWTIEFNADGTAKITNTYNGKVMQYDNTYNSYGIYSDNRGEMPTLYKKI